MIDYTKCFEVYIGEHNRTYLVTPYNIPNNLRKIALKRFKKAESQIEVVDGWIFGDDLYLNNPNISGAQLVWVAYIKHDIRRSTYGD